jgi:hypothetical protein
MEHECIALIHGIVADNTQAAIQRGGVIGIIIGVGSVCNDEAIPQVVG